ncbi:MAG: saccharopine dehydrogenase C-terminal domain-containing protein [Alphaproteobacteria bacterium]|nr:saccharopine dehydrogenase C-terminal domain-containing protein [Alphaproteobacteria bacterium]
MEHGNTILVFGAGKSSIYLIDYLKNVCLDLNLNLTVVDADLKAAQQKLQSFEKGFAVSLAIENESERNKIIEKAKVVVSLLPASLHILVAHSCLKFKKALFTASYIDQATQALAQDVEKAGILFLYELGLDPGIDHLSAKKIIDTIQAEGGKISSFKSHCGGLVSPKSDNNPWHYKISWNPRNIVLAGKQGAQYRQQGVIKELNYHDIFRNTGLVTTKNEQYAYYCNRDSVSYEAMYGLEHCPTFIRTTLRHPDFCKAWQEVVNLKLTATDPLEKTQIKESTADAWLKTMYQKYAGWERVAKNDILKTMFDFLVAQPIEFKPNLMSCHADLFQTILEKRLALEDHDTDRIVMIHELEYELAHKQCYLKSFLEIDGESNTKTAMAKTVGTPLAIAVELYLKNQLPLTGLHIPILPIFYNQILPKLATMGICFEESIQILNKD